MRNRVFTEFQSTFHQISNFTLPGRYHLNQVIKGSVISDRASCDSDASWQNAMKDAWSKSNHEGLTRQTLNEGLLQNIWPLRETKVKERLRNYIRLRETNRTRVNKWESKQSEERDAMEKMAEAGSASSGAPTQVSAVWWHIGPGAALDGQHTHSPFTPSFSAVLQNRKPRLRRGSNLPKSYSKKAAKLKNRIFQYC